MPCLNLSTNVSLDGVDTSPIFSEAIKAIANIIGRPESYVMVLLKGSIPISFNGNNEPAAFGEVISMGGINSEVKKKLISAIGTILETKLSVPKSRFFLKVFDTTAMRFDSKI
ncbi:macrophage migration inhibitory factor homolog [Telopea speciosissima]|uniref:macrophage migration inhibitory factor homolog n=1 Tax=Telopea speciosissima TaxID=54955 RepID=UPI001CC58ACB|nr:macrophage migration inhibitory factor homolog [Telopea speciosissima]XP_043701879.1 macrophage migration inhibitory factor homolog [Telopea speciosissima]